ncbi:MAG TPA: hypothetical protein VHE55_17485 [Fimbriimonadaceae bacterium]|nr:hypothetical protein [Fimbriimonadaceae bacterium]
MLTATNTFTGPVVLNSGTLRSTSSGGFGTGTIIVNGGTLEADTWIRNPIQLNADLRGYLYLDATSSITANNSTVGWLSAGGWSDCIASYYGPTVVTGLRLGPHALIPNSTEFYLNGSLTLDNPPAGHSTLNPSAPVHMANASVVYSPSSGDSLQNFGDTDVQSSSSISFFTYGSTVLHLASLQSSRGLLALYGHGLGQPPAQGVCNLICDQVPQMIGGGGAPGSPNVSIVPFIFADNNSPNNNPDQTIETLATYDLNGVRPLNLSTEFSTSLSGDPTNNLLLNDNLDVGAGKTVNAVVVGSGAINYGQGTLHVTSGTILNATRQTGIGSKVDFGAAHAFIYCQHPLELANDLTGSNGMSTGGVERITLDGNNAGVTGGLDLSNIVEFSTAQSLPGQGMIRSYNGGLRPLFTPYTLTRDVYTGGQLFLESAGSGFQFEVDSILSGPGQVWTDGDVRLLGANTYSGNTQVNGTLRYPSDQVFGQSPIIGLAGGTLAMEGPWTTNRTLNTSGTSTINVGSFDAVLNGPVTNTSTLSKLGSGTLTFNGKVNLTSTVISAGSCIFNGLGTNGVMKIATTSGTTGQLAGTGYLESIALGSGGSISPGVAGPGILHGGTLTWNGGGSIYFDLGNSSEQIQLTGALTQGSGGSHVFHFAASPSIQVGTYPLITFASTDFTVGQFSFDGLPVGVVGHFSQTGLQLQFVVTSVPTQIIDPISYELVDGSLVSGGLQELKEADSQYFVAKPTVVSSGGNWRTVGGPVQVVISGVCQEFGPSSLKLKVVGHASQAIKQTLEVFDFQANTYIVVDARNLALGDQVVEVGVVGDPSRYVQASTGTVRARLTYQPIGPVLSLNWKASIDQSIWEALP